VLSNRMLSFKLDACVMWRVQLFKTPTLLFSSLSRYIEDLLSPLPPLSLEFTLP
jgi:hypothetical protein